MLKPTQRDPLHVLHAERGLPKRYKKILFIEDDDDFGELLAPHLEEELGGLVVRARDPYEAMNLFVDGYYDLVILDWNLPDMNGRETLKQAEVALSVEPDVSFRWEEGQVPVIILSGLEKKNFVDLNGAYFRLAGSVTKKQSLEGILNNLRLTAQDVSPSV